MLLIVQIHGRINHVYLSINTMHWHFFAQFSFNCWLLTSSSWSGHLDCVAGVQVMIVYRYIEKLKERRPPVSMAQIGVITPYHKQKMKLRRLLEGKGCPNVKVGSVEEFQVGGITSLMRQIHCTSWKQYIQTQKQTWNTILLRTYAW